MDKKSMLEAMISHYTNGNKAKFATLLGVSAQTISAWTARNTFDTELIYTKCSCISADWLLSGEGSMLRESVQPPIEPVSAPSDAMAMRLMDKLDEKDTLLKEKESKIDHLQSELRSMEKELAFLKAKYPEETVNPPKVLGSAKDVSIKKRSSPNADNATSATAP